MSCTHTVPVTTREHVGYDHEDNKVYEDVTVMRSTEDDIDNHRFQCTQCGKIGYYSYAARQYYEKGVDHPLINMDTELS